tara:strand:+ start:73 stop:363 length:291 start_codon:yes stop_codon:yes gene_type:complete
MFIKSLIKTLAKNKIRQITPIAGPGYKLKIIEIVNPIIEIKRPNIEDITMAIGRFGARFSIPSMVGIDKKVITKTKPKAGKELHITKMVVIFKNKL